MQIGPWPESEQREEFDRPIPAALVTGGEGGGAWELQGAKATCWWGQVEEEAAGGGSSTASSGGRSTENGGEGAPVGTGQGGEVCELREDEVELEVVSAWTEEG